RLHTPALYILTYSSSLYCHSIPYCVFFFNDPAPSEIYTLSLHDALPIFASVLQQTQTSARSLKFELTEGGLISNVGAAREALDRSEEHTSELQSPYDLVCRLLLEKKNQQENSTTREQYRTESGQMLTTRS